jgi:hypothetical protein
LVWDLRPNYQNFLFFDSVHPTGLAHQLTAEIAADDLAWGALDRIKQEHGNATIWSPRALMDQQSARRRL